jgi:hypothetical protein
MGESEKIVVVRDFPQVMGGAAGEFCKLYGRTFEPAPQFFYMAYLTCLGVAIGDRVTLDTGIGENPRLYTLILGESAKARKSTAARMTVKFFKDTLGDRGFNTSKGVGSAEGLQRLFKRGKNLLLTLDEFDSFLSKAGIKNSVLLQTVGSLFHETEYENATRDDHILIEDGHLSLLAASTIETFRGMNNPEFIKIGFDNRLFLVPGSVGEPKALPPRLTSEQSDPLKKHLDKVLEFVGSGILVKIDEFAYAVYVDWYASRGGDLESNRLDTYALRLMTLMALNELSDTITDKIAMQALDLVFWQERMRRIYNPILAENAYAWMEQTIVRLLEERGPLTRNQLRKFSNADRKGVHFFDRAIKNLDAEGITILVDYPKAMKYELV